MRGWEGRESRKEKEPFECANRTPATGTHFVPLNDDTKILTETDTETFFPIPNFPKPKPRLFPRPNFSETETDTFLPRPNFSETETEFFFPKPNFSKPKPKPSKI